MSMNKIFCVSCFNYWVVSSYVTRSEEKSMDLNAYYVHWFQWVYSRYDFIGYHSGPYHFFCSAAAPVFLLKEYLHSKLEHLHPVMNKRLWDEAVWIFKFFSGRVKYFLKSLPMILMRVTSTWLDCALIFLYSMLIFLSRIMIANLQNIHIYK